MSYAIGLHERVAKRDWKRLCELCNERVLAGDQVATYFLKDGGDFAGVVEHGACRAVCSAAWDQDPDWFPSPWSDGDHELLEECHAALARERAGGAA